jgi:hypothetical protein
VAAGGLWLWRVRVPSGLVAVVVPSALRVMAQPHRCTAMRWWKAQSKIKLGRAVRPPLERGRMWWDLAGGGALAAAREGAVPVPAGDGAAQVGGDSGSKSIRKPSPHSTRHAD